MSVAQNIKQIRTMFDLTQKELGEIAGVGENAVSKWENGYSTPRMGAVERIATCLGLTKFHIIEDGGMDHVDPVTKAATVPDSVPIDVAHEPRMKPVPLLSSAYVGLVGESQDAPTALDTVLVPGFLLEADPGCYACAVGDDCMNLCFPSECIVVISPNADATNGSIALAHVEGTGTVMRRVYRTGKTVVLSPESTNPDCEDIVITSHDRRSVAFGGRVVWFQPREAL